MTKLSLPKGFDAILTPFVSFQHNDLLSKDGFSKVESPGIQGVLNLFEVATMCRGNYGRTLQGSKHFV